MENNFSIKMVSESKNEIFIQNLKNVSIQTKIFPIEKQKIHLLLIV